MNGQQRQIVTKTEAIVALIAGVVSGGLFCAQAFSPLLGSLVGLFTGCTLFIAGLGFGTLAVILASIIGMITTFALTQEPTVSGAYFVLNALPISLIAILALRKGKDNIQYMSLGKLIAWLIGYLAFGFIATDLYMQLVHSITIQEFIQSFLDGQIGAILQENKDALDALPKEQMVKTQEQVQKFIVSIGNMYPGAFMFSTFSSIAMNAIIAVHLLRNSSREILRPTFDFTKIALPHWVAILCVISVAVAYFLTGYFGFMCANLAILLITVEMIEGLAIVHDYAAQKEEKAKKRFLWWLYIATGAIIVPIFIIAVIGIIDHVKDFRKIRT